jgi:hypothetical protein
MENFLLDPDPHLEKNMDALINTTVENLLLDSDPHLEKDMDVYNIQNSGKSTFRSGSALEAHGSGSDLMRYTISRFLSMCKADLDETERVNGIDKVLYWGNSTNRDIERDMPTV